MQTDIDFKQAKLWVKLIDKTTNEIIVSGLLVAFKDLPELLISFDFKHFFVTRENPLYNIEVIEDHNIVNFDSKKYESYIHPYINMHLRDVSNEYIFREFDMNELDPEIAPLVYILNDLGYKTTGSCCGHGEDEAWVHINFEDFFNLKNLVKILEKDEFKHDFVLTTHPNVINTHPREIRLSLQTTSKGQKAYDDVLRLTEYLKKESIKLNKLKNFKL